MSGNKQQGYECSKCKNNYSTAYSMYRHMRKVHNLDVNRCVTLYCPIENCNQSYDRYNALDTHLTHVHYIEIRKETFNFSDLTDFETWLRDITTSSKTKYIKRSCNSAYRYYRCHRSGLPKTSTDKINTMKSSVKIGRHCPSRIIAKITDRNVQVEFVPTHIGHECEIAKIPLSQKKRLDIACRLAASTNSVAAVAVPNEGQQQQHQPPHSLSINPQPQQPHHNHDLQELAQAVPQQTNSANANSSNTINASGSSNGNTVGVNSVNSNPQATTSTIIQNDSSLIVSLPQMKRDQQQLCHPMQQQQQQQQQQPTHIITASMAQPQLANNTNLSLMPISPNRQELTSKFDLLLNSIRSDKHASIVKAQLEVCFALIRD